MFQPELETLEREALARLRPEDLERVDRRVHMLARRQACSGPGAPHHATAMYREMDMGFWLEQAEAETATFA